MADETCPKQRLTVYFSGDVQGVGFRYAVRRVAEGFAVTGFVRNLSDGRVEVVAEGSADESDRFIETIRMKMGGYIMNVERNVGAAEGRFRGFDIRF